MLVSIIVPCRNEAAAIDGFLASVLTQELPSPGDALQVIVADGMSDDGTRTLLEARARHEDRLCLVDNPRGIVSSALNLAIARARGEVIVRMDVHTEYASDYVCQCVTVLRETGAANVGGPWRAEGEGGTQEAIAAAFQSRWVVGGARSRDLTYEGPVDTVYLGCWPRATFERYGGFDESLVRNQDDEHNLRLTRRGARIWQSARIVSRYRPRPMLGQLFRQQLQYGYWKPFVMRKHGRPASLRQLVPGLFVAVLALLGFAGLALPAAHAGFVALGQLYALYLIGVSLLVARATGWPLLARLPFVIATYHLGYGLGSLRGWLDVVRRASPSQTFGTLTR